MERLEGSITICKSGSAASRHLVSKSEFFNKDITFCITEDYIEFRIATLDCVKKRITPYKHKKTGWYHLHLTLPQDVEGKAYQFGSESNEDYVVIYLKEDE